MGCQYYGLHLSFDYCEFAASVDVQHGYKVAPYKCWGKHLVMVLVHFCIFILFH